MFKNFFLFELKYRLQRPMIYIFVLVNFFLAFAATVSDNIIIGGANDAVFLNSPHVIMTMTLFMTLIGIFMTTAIVNTSILRDFEHNFAPLIFSTPIKKLDYLSGRFLGAFLIALLPFLGVFAGIAVGAASPLVEANKLGAFSLTPYLNTFFVGVVPNVLLVSAVVFWLGATFRSSMISFLGAIGILVLYIVLLSFSSNLDNEGVAILSDPMGISSFELITKYWTVEEKNTQVLSLSGLFLFNRLIWIGASLLCLVAAYFQFSFIERRKKAKNTEVLQNRPATIFTPLEALPLVHVKDNLSLSVQQFINQAKIEFFGVIKSAPFIVLLLIGLLNMSGSLQSASKIRGTGNYPVTYLMVEAVRNSLFLFLVAIVMYYAGVLIWKERENKMNEIYDVAPYANWIPFTAKLSALMGIVVLVLLCAIGSGVSVQALNGYFNFEFGVYFREFLVYDLAWLFALAVLSMLVQTLVNNKYIGYFAFIILIIAFKFGPVALEIKSNLVSYASVPSYIYSDMNAWSLYAKGLAWFHTYWTLCAGFLSMVAILFWVRGKSLTFSQRLTIARQRLHGRTAILTGTLLILWLGTGSFLWYQTQIVNEVTSENAAEQSKIDYERNYKNYEHIAQPRITDVDYKIDIFPAERNYLASADLTVKNKTSEVIKQLHFTPTNDLPTKINIPGATLNLEDKEAGYLIYDLAQPLQPSETLQFEVKVEYISEGIENEISTTDVVQSGSFLANFRIIPLIGYSAKGELDDRNKRAENNLPARKNMKTLHANCSSACQNTYISSDSDWVNVSSTVSTSADQTAIAPGTLMKEWTENNRKYFQYELKKPVINFYSFVSGVYEIAKEEWTNPKGEKVDLEVYYHKGHGYNVDKMLSSLRSSLEYYTKNFTPYPHEQARIIEFPRYDSFAQAFPGTMPYSESFGFISNLKEEDAIDMTYYVVAHEMAHQWWAHQVIGAEVQGATMLSETFAQYSALMVMQEHYGKDKMKQFMRYEMDRYLRGRGQEQEKEVPLMYSEKQQYVYYRKGSVVMYALQDYIGEDSLNLALRRFAEDVSYQEAPYTNTLEFMTYLTAVTPDSLQYLLEDMFESITLYSNKTTDASFKALPNGQYEVTIDVNIEKFRADSLGHETLIAHDDFIDIGVFSEEKNKEEKYGRPIKVERHRISSTDTTFTLVVDELPFEAGIDPNYLLVDRFPEDNMRKVSEVE
ncbi:MAG: ABC-2 type transport system permease protein [Saprospiraceae bacterium]|jgi:ABC-2 type transport system permease protein